MPSREEPGHYRVGRNDNKHSRRKNGDFGVIRGEVAMDNGHQEWRHFCDGSLHASKWYAYRIGPTSDGSGYCLETTFLSVEDSKKDAVDYLTSRYTFEETH